MVPEFNYNKSLAFATVLHLQTLHVSSSLSIDRFAVLQFGTWSLESRALEVGAFGVVEV